MRAALAALLALAAVAAGAAHARGANGCAWGAVSSKVGCLAPTYECRPVHAAAYRRHAFACVHGHLSYDWSQLRRRPVRVPPFEGTCPLSPRTGGLSEFKLGGIPKWGIGPAWPVFGGVPTLDVPIEYDSGTYAEWGIRKAMWAIDPRYVGPVLVRGRQVDGGDLLRFESGEPGFTPESARDPAYELRLAGGYVHPAVTRVRTLGCYAYQFDGLGFSRTVVFRAVAK